MVESRRAAGKRGDGPMWVPVPPLTTVWAPASGTQWGAGSSVTTSPPPSITAPLWAMLTPTDARLRVCDPMKRCAAQRAPSRGRAGSAAANGQAKANQANAKHGHAGRFRHRREF